MMKEDRCSTGDSSFNEMYRNLFNKSSTPICMFYFSHPFGISTPSSTSTNVETKKRQKSKKYTTTTYLVTEIQKNVDESSQDECCDHSKSSEMIPWPKNLLLPPPIIRQLMETKQGKKLSDIDALLRQVRKQAWNTPKSHRSRNFWSRGSSISSDDFSSLTSPEIPRNNCKQKRTKMDKEKFSSNCRRQQLFFQRRYSVPEIIMRKYSLAQQKSYEESTRNSTVVGSPSSCCDETTIKCRNGGQRNANSKFTNSQTQSQSTTRVSSPIKYFIPLSPQSNMAMSPTSSAGGGGGNCGIGGNFFNGENISMRKQALLRRMWSREFQHTKYSGSWSPPLKRVAHLQKNRLEKFNTLPEVISSTSCEKCRELGVLGRSFDEDSNEAKETQSQSTIDSSVKRDPIANSKSSFASSSSSASTIVIHPVDELKNSPSKATTKTEENSNSTNNQKSIIDSNGNNIIICMSSTSSTTFQDQRTLSSQSDTATVISTNNDDDMLSVVQIDGNNNNKQHNLKLLRKQFSTQLEDKQLPRTPDDEIYRRLREDKLTEEEIDGYISRMLIDNLNNVIRNVVNENLKSTSSDDDNLANKGDLHHPHYPSQMSSEDLVASVGKKLLEYEKEGDNEETTMNHENNKFSKRHEMLSFLLKKGSFAGATPPPENEATQNIHQTTSNNSSAVSSPSTNTQQQLLAVQRENSENADAVKRAIVRYRGQAYQSLPDSYDEGEVAAVISTGTSYPAPSHPETVFVPRVLKAKTESMEVNPSSSSALDDDDFDDQIDSGEEEEEFLSDVDSIDGFLTMRESRKLSEFGYRQHRKAQALFKPIHLKGQAFFVPIVDSEQPIDEHIVVADTMPASLKEKLTLRQHRRDMRKQNEMKIKQWQMEKVMERKFGEIKMVEKLKKELEVDGTPFKILGPPISNGRHEAITTNVYRREPSQNGGGGGGWVSRNRQSQAVPPVIPEESTPTSEKSLKIITTTTTSKINPRNGIGNLESYKIDGRGNMQIQNPAKPTVAAQANSAPATIKSKTLAASRKKATFLSPAAKLARLRTQKSSNPTIPVRLNNTSSKRTPSHTINNPVTSSASSVDNNGDVRRRQVIKDVQQMSIYKSDLTPDPESGPNRKMWKTEIKEGDKHIEILEIVECVEGTASSSTAPEHFNFNSHSQFPPQPSSNHKINFHVSSSTSSHNNPTFVNKKTFSVTTTTKTSSGGHHHYKENQSRIPVPVQRYSRSKYPQQQHFRDKSPYEHNYSSSTDESLTSAGSSITNQPQSSTKVDRMIANLLMEALKSPEELGIEFQVENHCQKRQSLSPNDADSASTGYYSAGDSGSNRRSASNSAGKYQHRFEVIPEEKSSYTMESSNDDFIDDDEDDEDDENSTVEKLNEINNDWKSRKDSQNNDIKTRSSTPNKLDKDSDNEDENSNPKKLSTNNKTMNNLSVVKTTSTTSHNNIKAPSSNERGKSTKISSSSSSVQRSDNKSKRMSAGGESSAVEKEGGISNMKEDEESSTAMKSEDAFFHALLHNHHHHNHHSNLNPLSNNHFMSNKTSSTPSSSSNNHFHYHLYQYQTHNCCFNLLDHSKTSSTVTTAASNANNVENNFSTYRDESQAQSNMNTPHVNSDDKKDESSMENIIDVEYTNKNYHDKSAEDDKCSCTQKYLPYKINEKNVWQVYETSDCKYIQSKYEVNEVFEPSTADDDTPRELYSRSNFSDRIIYQARNQEEKCESSTTTTFDSGKLTNNKSDNEQQCKCVTDDMTKCDDQKSPTARDSYRQSGKLLNRPKATNNISRDQVKPVEKEIQNEITRNGGVKALKATKPISLPNATPSVQKFDDDCGSSVSSVSDETVKENQKAKINFDNEKQQTLMRQENKIAIPNIHQGWSVTVAGTHPELAPDVEMKLSFPKSKNNNNPPASTSSINSKDDESNKNEYPEVFFYKNNQLLPAEKQKQNPPEQPQTPLHSEYDYEPKPYYNQRRSLSMARLDSGMSAIKPKSYLPNLHMPRSTTRNAYKQQVQCTTISASKTIIPSRRSLSLDVGNRRMSLDSREREHHVGSASSELFSGLSVVGSEMRKTLKPKVKTMSERDVTKRHHHQNCFTRSNGYY